MKNKFKVGDHVYFIYPWGRTGEVLEGTLIGIIGWCLRQPDWQKERLELSQLNKE